MSYTEQEVNDFVRDHMHPFLNIMAEETRFKAFVEAMSEGHNSLQQSFTRLTLRWIYYLADQRHGVDLRNSASVKIAQRIKECLGDTVPYLPLI